MCSTFSDASANCPAKAQIEQNISAASKDLWINTFHKSIGKHLLNPMEEKTGHQKSITKNIKYKKKKNNIFLIFLVP